MNPYARFGLVSNSVSAAILVGGLAVFGPPVFDAISKVAGGAGPAMWGALGGAVMVLVVFWLAMTEAIFPTLFRFNTVRRIVLGKYYVEGTWLQAEKDEYTQRMSVIDIQPQGKGFIFSGYALNEDLEIESNTLIEFSKFEWPFMTYKYRNSLSDGSDGRREGVGEIHFEMNRDAARRYNGYLQYVQETGRLKIEGAKLTSNSEVRRLRSLDGRQKIFAKYWELFFHASIRMSAPVAAAPVERPAPVAQAPARRLTEMAAPAPTKVPVEEALPHVERRRDESVAVADEDGVIPRRRASDWRQDPEQVEEKVKAKAKPKSSAKRAAKKPVEPVAETAPEPKVEDVFEDFDDFREDDDVATGTDGPKSGASGFRSRRRRK